MAILTATIAALAAAGPARAGAIQQSRGQSLQGSFGGCDDTAHPGKPSGPSADRFSGKGPVTTAEAAAQQG